MATKFTHLIGRLVHAMLFMIAMSGAAKSCAGQASQMVAPTAAISREGFRSWTLFLVCNPDWVEPAKSGDLQNLYRRFRSFGDAIGKDNLAVWFWKRRVPFDDPNLAQNVDVARSAEFCRTLQLAPSKGPYLAIATEYPDVAKFPAERAIFELGGLNPVDLAKLLNNLNDQLLLQGRVEAALTAAQPNGTPTLSSQTSSLWLRLLEGTRQSMIGFGCKVKLQIVTALLTAELRECAKP